MYVFLVSHSLFIDSVYTCTRTTYPDRVIFSILFFFATKLVSLFVVPALLIPYMLFDPSCISTTLFKSSNVIVQLVYFNTPISILLFNWFSWFGIDILLIQKYPYTPKFK